MAICQNKWRKRPENKPFLTCGKCTACQENKRSAWVARMVLETVFNCRPFFFSMTYAKEPALDEVVEYMQKFPRAMRKRDYPVRYFMVTERGSKRGRIHQHALVWSPKMLVEDMRKTRKVVEASWPHGHVWFNALRGLAGIQYTTKYIVKESLHSTWSRRPTIGHEGYEFWKRAVQAHHDGKPYRKRAELPVFLNLNVLGEAWQVRVPEPTVKRFCLELGVPYAPDNSAVLRALGVPTAGPLDEDFFKSRKILIDKDGHFGYTRINGQESKTQSTSSNLG